MIQYLLPTIVLYLAGVLVIGTSIFTKNSKVLNYISVSGALISLIILLYDLMNFSFETFSVFQFDFPGTIFAILFVFILIFVIISTLKFNYSRAELFYSLILFSTGSMILAAYSYNLIAIFVTFEAASLATYAIASYPKNAKSLEASLKFFVIGALSSAFIIFGISYYYISTGSFNLGVSYNNLQLFILAFIFLVVGFGFKLSLFPFHSWAIDTYNGSRAPVSAFLSTASKLMALIVMIRIFLSSNFQIMIGTTGYTYVQVFFIIISILTMTYGNVTALAQRDVKRMLAYSSVANAGYLSLVFTVSGSIALSLALSSILIFSMAYILMKGGAFISMENFESINQGTTLEEISGIARKRPLFAVSFAILLFSLAGIPPTIGFMGKYFLFLSLIESNLWWLAIVAVINSAISVYYYFRVVMYMWKEPKSDFSTKGNIDFVILLFAIIVVILGILTPMFVGGLNTLWGGLP
ncbi:MAG: NADH-quinone oxidoreductase subunit N [Thermoplasmata archaeon]